MTASPLTLSAQGFPLHAQERNRGGAPALLFLHGFLDHCHSFDWVCEALPAGWRTVALDFRGHGRSAQLPPGAGYHLADHLLDVEGALESLGLPAVHLVGHSLGGTVSLLYAAARPQRVLSLTAIESLGPSGGEPEQAVARLQRLGEALSKRWRRRVYPSVEAVAARIRESNSSLPERAALHLALHGTRPVEGGFEFTFDPTLRRPSGIALDEPQLLAVLSAVRCPVQIIHGDAGYSFDDAQMRERLSRLTSPPLISLPGGHYVHLERPTEVAGHLARFISRVDSGAAAP
ncbi:MAG: alpha/beta hydrolase [Myxococcales bacterium]|nr:alpha/beta hydrolase [Myxococcales bacterium]